MDRWNSAHWEVKKRGYKGAAIALLQHFKNEPGVFLLESSQVEFPKGRYSFLSFDPFEIVATDGVACFDQLKKRYAQFADENLKTSWPLASGAVGFLAYDYGLGLERIVMRERQAGVIPQCYFGLYDFMIVVDHQLNELIVLSNGLPEKKQAARKKRAKQRLEHVWKELSVCLAKKSQSDFGLGSAPSGYSLELSSNFIKEQYLQAVQKALTYIEQGDIYQVNLSQRFSCDLDQKNIDPLDIYIALRAVSPSCFGAYFRGKDFSIISSSPEQFLNLQGSKVQTRPMKGTRARGKDKPSDQKNRQDIWQSPKEQAELLMITDLHRNDLGRVCEYGSVRVSKLRILEEYKTVFQTTALIEGQLRSECNAFDLLQACFPAGSITGCPKIRAMEVIEELEPDRREIYCGSLGYIDFSGDMDFNVLIRTLLYQKEQLSFHVGGGIVSDSTAEQEYEETLIKAQAIFRVLESMGKGLRYGEM